MSGPHLDSATRRDISRRLSEAAKGLDHSRPDQGSAGGVFRVGITGPQGAGKSTLIGLLAAYRVAAAGPLAVLAIDPTSPVSGGSLLGDRIRMDSIADNARIFIRSLPSRAATDGLCDNLEEVLHVLETHDFGEIIVETVGIGQAQYAVKRFVDTVVLVLSPGSGDSIQAMKAGLMELADIYVINKSDLADAARAAAELRTIIDRRWLADGDWRPPVLLTSTIKESGIVDLAHAIDARRAWAASHADAADTKRRRAQRSVRGLIETRLNHLIDAAEPHFWDGRVDVLCQTLIEQLATAFKAE